MVKIKKQLVRQSIIDKVTYGYGNPKTFIVVHETANTSKGANAQAHANLQSNGNSRNASWHYQVDDKQIIQSFNDDIQCWHAGGSYNRNSIGIEICVNSDGDFKKAVQNAVELIKYLMDKYNIPASRIITHREASGWKDCPHYLRKGSNGVTWNDLINAVKGTKVSKPKQPQTGSEQIKKSIDQLADEVIAGKHGTGAERKKALGNQFEAVQKRVNEKLLGSSAKKPSKSINTLVKETLAGKHGNGEARKKSLGKNYKAVMDVINGKTGKVKKSISQMASMIINDPKVPTGHENRRKWLGISKAEYEKVRAEVNRRL